MRLWPQIVVIVSLVLPVVFALLRTAGIQFVKPEGWDAPNKYRGTALLVVLINALLQAVVLGYGGFWERLR
jgi:hypothetical protein